MDKGGDADAVSVATAAGDKQQHNHNHVAVDEEKHGGTVTVFSSGPQVVEEDLKQQLANLLSLSGSMSRTVAKNLEEAKNKRYQFWSSQPVPQFDQEVDFDGPIEPHKLPEDVRAVPYTLPDGFFWSDIDVNDPQELQELYHLLNENYVEDEDNMFRFDYSPEFLKWALQPPGWMGEWHCGVRVSKNNKLVCFICAVPSKVRVYDK